jgi:hypothetical protein
VDADGLAPPEEVPGAGLEVGLAEALARAAGVAAATAGEGAALVTVATAGAGGAALVAAGAAEGAGAEDAAGVTAPVTAGVAEWVFAVQAAVSRIGTATRTAIARGRDGRGVTDTGVILPDRLPV